MAPFPSPTSTWHDKTYASLSPTRPELSAKGKIVLITGGGTGIGAETARYFAEAGASRIALLGRREQPLLDTKASIEKNFAGVKVFTASADVTKQSEVDSAFVKFLDDGSKLHVLVSNAAVTGAIGPVGAIEADKIFEGIEINIKGSLYVAQAFIHHAAEDAVAIDISSSAAHWEFGGGLPSYCTAKMAVVRLWDSIAGAHPKLSIFHIQPGIIDTAMNREVGGVAAFGFEDNASFNVWLASPEALFLKGRFLWSNWDVDELKSRAKEIEASTEFTIGLLSWPFGHSDWKLELAATDDSLFKQE